MQPWELTLEAFVGEALVSEAFEIDGRDGNGEIIWAAAGTGVDPVRAPGGYVIRRLPDFEPPNTFVLFAPDGGPCGWYSDAMCWVDLEHRRRGLSTALILASAAFLEGRPIRPCAGAIGFSEAGYAAHAAAHRVAVTMALEAGLVVPAEVMAGVEGCGDAATPGRPGP